MFRHTCVFSELNEKSLVLAKDIRSNHKHAMLVFVNVDNETIESQEALLSKALELKDSLKEWKMLVNQFGDNSIDSRLYENFEMEYYTTLIDHLNMNNEEISEFEKIMYWEDINQYIRRIEKRSHIHSYVKKIIAQRDMNEKEFSSSQSEA